LVTVIACYGLLANSIAIVDRRDVAGADCGDLAVGLADRDQAWFAVALSCLVGRTIWIVVIEVIIGVVHKDAPLTAEITVRMSSTLFDLMIALAGGADGAIAMVSPPIGTATAGVAIAGASNWNPIGARRICAGVGMLLSSP
jgi:Domain of unknown function (DUF389)